MGENPTRCITLATDVGDFNPCARNFGKNRGQFERFVSRKVKMLPIFCGKVFAFRVSKRRLEITLIGQKQLVGGLTG
jgi:hypothetical protein